MSTDRTFPSIICIEKFFNTFYNKLRKQKEYPKYPLPPLKISQKYKKSVLARLESIELDRKFHKRPIAPDRTADKTKEVNLQNFLEIFTNPVKYFHKKSMERMF